MECSPEIDDLSLTAQERKSVSNKLKMADGSGMASEVLEGGKQGQTHAHTYAHVHTHARTYARTHTHTCTNAHRGQGGSFAPL